MNSRRGMGSIYDRGGVKWIKYHHHGEAIRESSGSGKDADARKLLKKRLGEISVGHFIGPDADKVTVRELADDYENDYRVNGKKSLDKAQRSVNHLLEFFGDGRAHHIGADIVRKYVSERLENKAANATINRELAALKRMFNLGIEAAKIYRKPHITMLQEDNVRTGFFEYSQFVGLRDVLPDYFKGPATFAYYTGWRKREILSLKWNQVDLNARSVRLDPGTTKSREGRVIILEGELLEAIKEQSERRKVAEIPGHSPTLLCLYVFHRNGKRISDIRDVWQNACLAAGLGQMMEVEKDGEKKKKYVGKIFHDFRRTAVRNMVRAGVPERVAMTVSGHKTRNVFERYNIVNEDDLKDAARKTWSMPKTRRRYPQTSSL